MKMLDYLAKEPWLPEESAIFSKKVSLPEKARGPAVLGGSWWRELSH